MPPGTGDIQLTLAQKVPVTGAVIVTTPQDIALIDARKGLKMFEKVGVPIVGIVENMSVHICSNCGHAEHIFGEGGAQRMCSEYGVPFLGAPAARHPHPRAGGLGAPDGRRRSRRQGRADLPGDRAARWRSRWRRRPPTSRRNFRASSSRTPKAKGEWASVDPSQTSGSAELARWRDAA